MSRTEREARRRRHDREVAWILGVVVVTVVVAIGTPLLGIRSFSAADLVLGRAPWQATAPEGFVAQNPFVSDTVDGYLPMRAEFRRQLFAGHLPLWAADPSGGSPLGSVPDFGVLSPLNLPYWVMPLWYAPGIAKLLELAVAIGATFLFLRRIGLGRTAGMVGGLVYAFCGFQVVWTNWPQTHVGALIPALFWAVELAIDRRTLRAALPITLIAAVMLFEGFPSVTGYAVIAAAIYAAVRLVAEREPAAAARRRTGAFLAVAAVLAVGVAAIQLLPFLHRLGLIDLAYRQQTAGDHLPLHAILTLAFPDALGSPLRRSYWGAINYIELQSFIGASALVLIAVAAARGRELTVARGARTFLWAGAAVAAMLLFLGGPLLWLLQRLPLFDTNFIGRMRSVFGFLLAALAAIGMEAAGRRAEDRRRARIVWIAFGALVVLGAVWAWSLAARAHGSLLPGAAIALGAGGATLALVLLAPREVRVRRLLPWTVPVLIAFEALAFTLPFWPRIPLDEFYPSTPTHTYLERHLGHDRIASGGIAMSPGTTTYYGIRALTAHSFFAETWRDLVLAVDPHAFDRSPTLPILDPTGAVASSPILDRLAVRYFVSAPEPPVIGRTVPVTAPVGTVALSAGAALEATIPRGPLRAVVVWLQEPPAVAGPASLRVQILDAAGAPLTDGTRRLPADETAGTFAIAVPEADATNDPAAPGPLTARISLEAAAGSVRLGADATGDPAVQLIEADDDGLRLVRTDGALVYERLRALPRIRWASHAIVIADRAARIAALARPIPPDTVVLSAPGPAASGRGARLDIREDGDERIRIGVSAAGDGYVVVADALQDGWVATLDGAPAPLVDADHAGVAVFVPAGAHEIELRYEPPGWRRGVAVTVISLLILLFVAVAPGSRSRREPADRSAVPVTDDRS
ncbi:MAG TPA: hypothetical protein VK646_05815 [Actinomycetota bacterium]|nr:hypothetical protein [Actinomycetota bacterium]